MPKVTDEHRAARRQQILAATLRCVAVEGFHRTTMADVIRESGLSAGAVYGYFKSKDELILAIAEFGLGLMEAEVGALTARDPVPSPEEVTEHLAGAVVTQAEAGDVDITRVLVAVWAEAVRDENVRAIVSERIRYLRDRYARLVRVQQDAGLIDPAADPEHLTQVLVGMMPGFILQRLVLQDVEPAGYAEGLAALRRPAAPPARPRRG